MWQHAGDPEISEGTYPGGFDGIVFKYPLRDGERLSFTVVKIGWHAWMRASAEPMTARTLMAVDTQGLSEVERYTSEPWPARVIEVRTSGEPLVIKRTLASPARTA